MAITVNILPPFTAPTLSSVTVQAGAGTIAPGDYQFTMYSLAINRSRAPLRRSPLSDIKDITITENSAITFNYTHAGDATYFCLVGRKVGFPWYVYQTSPVSFLISSYPTSVQCTTYNFSTRYTTLENFEHYEESYFGLSTDKGVGTIQLTGSGGSIRAEDINDAFIASADTIDGEDFLTMKNMGIITTYSFDATTVGSATFYMSGGLFYFYGGFTNYGSDLQLIGSGARAPTRIHVPQKGGYFLNGYIENAIMEFALVNIGLHADTVQTGGMFNTQPGSFINSMMFDYYAEFSPYWTDSLYKTSGGRVGEVTIEDTTMFSTYVYPRCLNPCTFNRCTFNVRDSHYRIFYLPNSETGIPTFNDCLFQNSLGEQIKYKDLGIWAHDYYNKVGTIEFYNTLNYTIKGNDNLPIENVLINIVDGLDNEYNFYTDSSGIIDEKVIVFKHHNIIGTPSTEGVDYDYNNFTITFSKDEYDTEIQEIEISSKQDDVVVLVETAAPVYIETSIGGSITSQQLSGALESPQLTGLIDTITISAEITEE